MILPAHWALFLGIFLSFLLKKDSSIPKIAKKWSSHLLQISVVLLGSSLSFHHVLQEGSTGIIITALGLFIIFLLGYFGMRIFKVEEKLGTLLTMGTAICGGSAIGALAPVIGAETLTITISVTIVFLFNTVSLFIFPYLGEFFELSQKAFGTWAALAIHDTSSVIGASTLYGKEALEVATTLKLTRALWIIPITFIFSLKLKRESHSSPLPWFVGGFLLMSLLFTFYTPVHHLKSLFVFISKNGFSLTLFLIGMTFNFQKMKDIGFRPFLFAITLWLLTVIISFTYVKFLI